MEAIFNWFSRIFGSMFRARKHRYQQRMEAKVRRATVGKVQQKMHGAMNKMDRKVNKAQDNIMPGGKGKKSGGAAPQQKQPQQKQPQQTND